jgi:FkbM family methyltransferase
MTEVEGFRFWFNSSDREMGVLMALGVYEPRTVRLVRQLVKPGMRVIDVGAQTGFYTCLMASRVGHEGYVYALEPMPASFDLLERNVRENDFQERVSLVRAAASNERSTIRATVLSNMYVIGSEDGDERAPIDAIRLDDLVDAPVDLVKIDVEGHEPAAIDGMRALLARRKPLIISEVNSYWLRTCSGESAADYVDFLSSLGYDVYNVDDLTRPLAGRTLRLGDLDTIDVIAVPFGTSLPA